MVGFPSILASFLRLSVQQSVGLLQLSTRWLKFSQIGFFLTLSSCEIFADMLWFRSLLWPFRHVRKSSAHTRPHARKSSHSDSGKPQKESEPHLPAKKPEPKTNAEISRTASNMLKYALTTLSLISSSIPVAGILGSVIDPILDITERIEQTSDNATGLTQLALRIERLTPIVIQMAESEPAIVEKLRKELASITTELTAARAKGKLNQFFNSVDNASTLDKHNTALDRLIADCTLATVQGIAQFFRELSNSKLQQPYPNITEGIGGAGDGGEDEGSQIDRDPNELTDCTQIVESFSVNTDTAKILAKLDAIEATQTALIHSLRHIVCGPSSPSVSHGPTRS
ncbi:hypothetical protein MSAN_02436700 [Mycena sanguinolenta]|uniref:Uncharacterized protein n=1 Tax=Mycena sanguinolenta TaxID=230812 RepID=A0A8H7CBX1_9AGAR|nr:hypothetical protein MSAN_02436700 [Mycena sanguinolenta]